LVESRAGTLEGSDSAKDKEEIVLRYGGKFMSGARRDPGGDRKYTRLESPFYNPSDPSIQPTKRDHLEFGLIGKRAGGDDQAGLAGEESPGVR